MPVPVPSKTQRTQKASRGAPGQVAGEGTGSEGTAQERSSKKARLVVAAAETKETMVPNLKTAKPENGL